MTEDGITIKRKQLLFRSWHRGTREIDLLLGKFADRHVPEMDAGQLELYDRFLSNNDPDIFNWVTAAEPLPPEEENEVVRALIRFYAA
jgi:antitoxin CptB